MFRIVMAVMLVAAIAGVGVQLSVLPAAAQQGPSATRSFDKRTVEPGENVTVTITAENYGAAGGGVTETLPEGFSYVSSSLDSEQVRETAQTVRFILQGETSFTYTVTASSTAGGYDFSGTLRDDDRQDHTVGGASRVTVEAAAPPPEAEPSATRSFDKRTVEPGENVTVTITAENYGAAGGVTETLPEGFSYVSSSLDSEQVRETAQTVRFILQGETSFTYTVTASSTAGGYDFSGTLRDDDRQDHTVGGASRVTVEAAAPPPEAEPSATRSFDKRTVEPGENVTVTITAENYGAAGGVTETLPEGFSYVSSSLNSEQVRETAQTVRFILQGETSFTYTVTASSVEASHTFSGTLRDDDRQDHTVGGPTRVTVRVPAPAPQRNRSPAFPGSSTTRSIDENSASGANVGARVRATDADRDRLTYSLTGTDAGSFTINSSGQIMVGTGTMLDYETKASYTVTVRATDPDNASDSITVMVTVVNMDEDGVVTITPDTTPQVGEEITAQVTDPDGNPSDTLPIAMDTVITGATWQWASSDAMDGTFTNIDGETNASYTPVDADANMFLRATASYTDGHGPDTAMVVTAAVGATTTFDPLTYDTDGSGQISTKLEYLAASRDYQDDVITRSELAQVLLDYTNFLNPL